MGRRRGRDRLQRRSLLRRQLRRCDWRRHDHLQVLNVRTPKNDKAVDIKGGRDRRASVRPHAILRAVTAHVLQLHRAVLRVDTV
jgi:hypothetical protein